MKWQYKTIKLATTGWFVGGNLDEKELDRELNKLGRDGWELTSAFDTNHNNGGTRDVVVILKRPIS